MHIQIWSDIACPFCYIGKHHLELALQDLADKETIEILFRSFELDPSAPKQVTENIYQQLSRKYGMSLEEAKNTTTRIAAQGQSINLTFDFAQLQPTNTLDAHRLIHLAAEAGLMTEMTERLFKAFFTDSFNIADQQILIQLAKDVGLAADKVTNMLDSSQYIDQVRADELAAKQREIHSVPYFIFDDKYAVSGAQPVSVFKDILTKLSNESLIEDRNIPTSTTGCSDDNCTI